jgi:hypothetical protein
VNTAAGRDGNRTTFTDVKDGGTPAVTGYCYDWADRLTGTTVSTGPAVAGASPVSGTALTINSWPNRRIRIVLKNSTDLVVMPLRRGAVQPVHRDQFEPTLELLRPFFQPR